MKRSRRRGTPCVGGIRMGEDGEVHCGGLVDCDEEFSVVCCADGSGYYSIVRHVSATLSELVLW